MTFVFDENFPRSAKAMLEKSGHVVYDMRDILEPGADDNSVCVIQHMSGREFEDAKSYCPSL